MTKKEYKEATRKKDLKKGANFSLFKKDRVKIEAITRNNGLLYKIKTF